MQVVRLVEHQGDLFNIEPSVIHTNPPGLARERFHRWFGLCQFKRADLPVAIRVECNERLDVGARKSKFRLDAFRQNSQLTAAQPRIVGCAWPTESQEKKAGAEKTEGYTTMPTPSPPLAGGEGEDFHAFQPSVSCGLPLVLFRPLAFGITHL